jgi:hypothetical protein
MDMINLFASALAEVAGITLAHCVGLVRLSIKDAGLNPDQALAYNDFKRVFDINLRQRLKAIDVKNADEAIVKLTQVLNEKQSLLTMTAR